MVFVVLGRDALRLPLAEANHPHNSVFRDAAVELALVSAVVGHGYLARCSLRRVAQAMPLWVLIPAGDAQIPWRERVGVKHCGHMLSVRMLRVPAEVPRRV